MSNFLDYIRTIFKLTSMQGKPYAIYSQTTGTGTSEYINFTAPVDGWLFAYIYSPAEDGLSRIRIYCKKDSSDLLASTSFGKRPQGGTGSVYIPVSKGMQCGVWAENGIDFAYQFVTDKSAE